MDDQYVYRSYQNGDEEEIVGLLQEVFGKWPSVKCSSPLEHWKWKYLDNPYQKQENFENPLTIVCEYRGKIIGVMNTFLLRIKIGDKTCLVCLGADGAVHVNHRRKGVSSRARNMRDNELAIRGVELVLSTTDNPILIARNKRKGYPIFPHEIVTYVKIIDIYEHMRHVDSDNKNVMKYGYLFRKSVSRIVNLVKQKPKKIHIIETWDHFDESVDVFWKKIEPKYLFILEREHDYLNWKYFDPRNAKYTIRGIERDGEIIGYSVLSIQEDDGYLTGLVVDIVVDPIEFEVAESLIVDAVDFFDALNVNFVKMRMVKGHMFSDLLSRSGFVDSRRRSHTSFLPLLDVSEQFDLFMKSKPEQVHYVYGDLDVN